MIKNAKFSGYYFYMNLNVWGDFQICISVPISKFTIIQPAPLQNLNSSKVPSWKFVRKLMSFLLKKCQNNLYVEYFEVVQQN